MEKEEKPIEVVNNKKACSLLNCSRSKFYREYKDKLTHYKDRSKKELLFSLKEVSELAEQENITQPDGITFITNYTVIE